MKVDRIGALVSALPFAVVGALLLAAYLWAGRGQPDAANARDVPDGRRLQDAGDGGIPAGPRANASSRARLLPRQPVDQ